MSDRLYNILGIAIILLAVRGCTRNDSSERDYVFEAENSSLSYQTNTYSPSHSNFPVISQEECIEPENPYDEYHEEGHYAGFEWAERTGGYCDGNSMSFNEGCEEYYRQEEAFYECEDNQ